MLSFAVWGIGDIFRRSDRTVVVAEVGQIEINGREFSQQFTRQTKEISKYIGADLDAKKARKLGFIDETIGGLTARALFTNAAMDLGLTVNDKLVREWIKNDKNFHDEFGEFSEFLFRELTYESGYSEESYVEGTRQDIARDQLLNSISVNFSPPESILDSLAAFRSEQREAQTFTLKFETITDLKNPKKETLMEYYSKNKEKFKKPEYRKISMIDVNARDLVGAIKISEDKITELYQDKEETFISPERRFVEQIIFTKESDAKKGLERISKGDDFYQVAKDVANQDKKETSLGWNERDNMPDDIASVVFNLEKETTSKIHKTDFGWHIFKVTKIEAEKRKSLDEVRESLRVELASEKAVEELYELIEKVQDEIGGGATLEEAASSLNLKLKKIESIDSKGKDNDGKEIGAIPKYRFLDEIFKEDKSSLTDLIETDDDGFFSLQYLSSGRYCILGLGRESVGRPVGSAVFRLGLPISEALFLNDQDVIANVTMRMKTHESPLKLTRSDVVDQRWGRLFFNRSVKELPLKNLVHIIQEDTLLLIPEIFLDPENGNNCLLYTLTLPTNREV